MNKDQARTIVRKVREHWRVSTIFLLQLSADDLAFDLDADPVDGVNFKVLDAALGRMRSDPRWVE